MIIGYRRRYRPVVRALVALAAGTGACSPGVDARRLPEAVHADSAGVEIVLNAFAATTVPVFATLDTVPGLRLGALEGRPEEQFGRVVGVAPLVDGGVAVLDGQAAEVRLFDADGAYRTSFGSRGDGPGEFQSPIELALLPGDTLAVYDAVPRRITRFGSDGALGRITTLEGTRGRITAASFLSDGRLVGQSIWLHPDGGPLPGPEPTFVRDTAVLTLFTSDGAVDDTVDVVPGREAVVKIETSEASISVLKRSSAFARTHVFTAHPDGIWSSSNDRFELRLREPESGRLVRIVRAPGLEMPVSDGLADTIRDRALEEAETADERSLMETWYGLSPRPDMRPAYDRIVVDDRAQLWVRAWSAPDLATRWWVFARGGDLLGSVDVPTGMTITAVRCGSAWGVVRDELDVSYVVRYALRGIDAC